MDKRGLNRLADALGWTGAVAGWTTCSFERLWRSLKYEYVYLNAFETGSELRAGLNRWIAYYNGQRPHSRLGGRTADEVYGQIAATPSPAHAPEMAFSRMAA